MFDFQNIGPDGWIAPDKYLVVNKTQTLTAEEQAQALANLGLDDLQPGDLPVATADTLGGIIIGSGLSVTASGVAGIDWTGELALAGTDSFGAVPKIEADHVNNPSPVFLIANPGSGIWSLPAGDFKYYDGTISVDWDKMPGNVFRTDKTNIVTGFTSFTQSVSVAAPSGDGHAVNVASLKSGSLAAKLRNISVYEPDQGSTITLDRNGDIYMGYDETNNEIYVQAYGGAALSLRTYGAASFTLASGERIKVSDADGMTTQSVAYLSDIPNNIFQTDKTNIVTGLTSYTQPVNVANATGDGHAVNRLQVERGDGIKTPSQFDYRALGFCSRVGGSPACYMDRLYNIGNTPVAFGQLNGVNDGDGNNYAGTLLTMTLDLPYMAEAVRQPDYIDQAPLGQTAYFGACATFPAAGGTIVQTVDAAGKLVKAYDCQVAGWAHYNYSEFVKSVPAIYSSDYHADKQLRFGFCQNMLGTTEAAMLAKMTDAALKYGLLAVLPNDAVKIILVWGGNTGSLTKMLPANTTGMWVQRYNGAIDFVGWSMTNYGWMKIGLILLAYGKSGLGAFRNFRGDIYGLASGTRPSPSQLYPLSQCTFVAANAAETKQATILLADKSCVITPKDAWIAVTTDGAGALNIAIEANTSGAVRRGLCDVALSNGITYSIHVTQKA